MQQKKAWLGALLGAATVGAGFATPASAAVVVRDTYLDGTRSDPAAPTYSENGVDTDADGDIESAWYKGGGGTFVSSTGQVLATLQTGSSSTYTTYFTPSAATSVNLAAVGDQMRVQWNFRTGNVNSTDAGQGFRLAIVNSPDSTRVSSEAAPGNGAYAGYALFGNMRTGTVGNTNSYGLYERVDPSTASALLSGSASWGANGAAGVLANGLASGAGGYESNTNYVFTATFTRTAAGLDINFTTVGGTALGGTGTASVSYSDASPNSYAFNTFSLRPSTPEGTADAFTFTRFQVDYTAAPEPASLSLLALGGLALGRRRRA